MARHTRTFPPDAGHISAPAARALPYRRSIEHKRVQRIRKAIREGRFQIIPTRIADKLIAFEQRIKNVLYRETFPH